MKPQFPHNLKFWQHLNISVYLTVAFILATSIPILISGYLMTSQAEKALLAEKQAKLMAATRMLDNYFATDYRALLQQEGFAGASREEQIKCLNRLLAPFTDTVASAFPGIGVGYYSRELDAILTYGPSKEYGQKVGQPIAPDHPGRQVMASGEARIETGLMVRGPIMNAMLPVKRNGRVIGYIWANELLSTIDEQLRLMELKVRRTLIVGLLLSVLLAWFIASLVSKEVQRIKKGLYQLRFDLRHRLSSSLGEFQEIAREINRLAQTLLSTKTHNEYILRGVTSGVITTDLQGLITTINPAATELLGLKEENVLDKPFEEIFAQAPEIKTLWLHTHETGNTYPDKEIVFKAGGKTLYLLISTAALLGKKERLGTIIVLRDLTPLRQLEEQIRQADRLAAVGELAVGIAHEIRNPLTSIQGYTQLLKEELPPAIPQQEYLTIIVKEVNRANRILEQLLRFARPAPPQFSLIDLEAEIEQALMLLQIPGNKSITINRHYDHVPLIMGDPLQLKQAILNILINAVQAIGVKEGTITLATGLYNGTSEVRVTISDTGCGIPAEHLDKLFNPFFTTKEKGTGLGLAMCHQIISMHGGRIEVESRPGEGSTFTIILPCYKEEVEKWLDL